MGSSSEPVGCAATAGMPTPGTTVCAARRNDGHGRERVPATVVARGPTALGALRALRIAGIPAYVACPAGDLVTRSRWYRAVPGSSGWDGSVGPHVHGILRSLPLPRAVLVPGRDDAALWIANLPQGDLADRFRVSSSGRASLEILQDKGPLRGVPGQHRHGAPAHVHD